MTDPRDEALRLAREALAEMLRVDKAMSDTGIDTTVVKAARLRARRALTAIDGYLSQSDETKARAALRALTGGDDRE